MRTVLALSVAVLVMSSPAKAGFFGDFVDGYIDGVIIGGVISGDSDAVVDGIIIGGTLDIIDGAQRNRDANRNRYYNDRNTDRGSQAGNPPPASSANALVVEVQLSLRRLGYNPGPADGVPGQATGKAIRSYQGKKGLPQDNKITQALLDHMRKNGG